MAEAADPGLALKAAIRETRGRIAARLDDTAEALATLFIAPSANGAGPREAGVVGLIASSVAAAGRTRRAWMHAQSSGLITKATAAAALIGAASIVAVIRTRRTRRNPLLSPMANEQAPPHRESAVG